MVDVGIMACMTGPDSPTRDARSKVLRSLLARVRRQGRGPLLGAYATALRGPGVEFRDVRPYEPGDDVRRLDPAVSARTGVPHVRQYSAEREQFIRLIVDVSGSMRFGTRITKADRASEVVGLIAMAAIANRDRVGYTLVSDCIEEHRRPGRGERAAQRAVRAALGREFRSSKTDLAVGLRGLGGLRRGIGFIISDFLGPIDPRALRLAARRQEMIAVRISDPAELALPDLGRVCIVDAESGTPFEVDTSRSSVRTAIDRLTARRRDEARQLLRESGIDLIEIQTNKPAIPRLLTYFRRRARRR